MDAVLALRILRRLPCLPTSQQARVAAQLVAAMATSDTAERNGVLVSERAAVLRDWLASEAACASVGEALKTALADDDYSMVHHYNSCAWGGGLATVRKVIH